MRIRELFRLSFAKMVFSNFFSKNAGILLVGSVAFYTLLSLIPLIGLLLVVLSTVIDVHTLSKVVAAQLQMMVPGTSGPRIMAEVESFVEHRKLAGGVGAIAIMFFGSQAFSTLERAMGLIFHKRRARVRRHFVTSLTLPYVYIAALGAGLLLITGLNAFLEWAGERTVTIGTHAIDLGGPVMLVIPFLRLVTEIVLFTSIYLVFPGGRVKVKHAIMGGTCATILWELTRRLMVWYYTQTSLSVVSVVYGSLANAFVALLAMEAAALIVLLSAQAIAEYEAIEYPVAKPPPDDSVEEPLRREP